MIHHLSNTLTFQTPEGVRFSYYLAGPAIRFMAWFIDLLAIAAVMIVFGSLLSLVSLLSPDLSGALYYLLFFVLSVCYSLILEWRWNGQTLGKKLFRLRVLDASGLKLTLFQVVLRNLLRPVDSLPLFYCLGGFVSLIHPQYQRLGDISAGTLVIREQTYTMPKIEHLLKGKFNSFKAYPHLCARLRQKTPHLLAHTAMQALLRNPQLSPQARHELYQALVHELQSLVPFPEEATLGLTPEQHVRNCVEILF